MSSGRQQDTQSNTLTPAGNRSALYIISIFPRPTQTTQLSGEAGKRGRNPRIMFHAFFAFPGEFGCSLRRHFGISVF